MDKDDDKRWHPNPSVGLNVWGPLVPASDCRGCLAVCAGLQIFGGACFFFFPGRRPPLGRSIWMNRLVKLAGWGAGSYLVFDAGLELTRFILPYDPWAEDARKARATLPVGNGFLAKWFGPVGYKAVSFNEWCDRVEAFRGRNAAPVEAANLQKMLVKIRQANRITAEKVVGEIDDRTFDHELVYPESDLPEDIDLDDIDFDELDLDLWSQFDVVSAMNLVILARSVPANQKKVDDSGTLTQNVTYARVPELIRRF